MTQNLNDTFNTTTKSSTINNSILLNFKENNSNKDNNLMLNNTPVSNSLNGNNLGQSQTQTQSMFYFSKGKFDADSDDLDELEDTDKVIEESPNGRWSKLITEIIIQKLADFDSSHLAIDTDKGCEVILSFINYIV